eukprot:1749164-Prorocentrum_lima.AAC.1
MHQEHSAEPTTPNIVGPMAATQDASTHAAPLTTWSEEVDTGVGEWDVLNNEEASFHSTTEEEEYHDD